MADQWKVVMSVKELGSGGIFQEKVLVVARDESERQALRNVVIENGGEFWDVPQSLQEKVASSTVAAKFVFGYWAPKTGPHFRMTDVLAGHFRKKIV